MNLKRHNPDAFLDQDYPKGEAFCQKFLSSPEFTVEFLTKFKAFRRASEKTKEGYSRDVAAALCQKELDPLEFLYEYVRIPRTWLSFKQGHYSQIPKLNSPEELLTSFGEPGWYGPITGLESSSAWYIYTVKVPHHLPILENSEGIPYEKPETFETKFIRWPIIAEVNNNYMALSWNGFSFVEDDSPTSKKSQFAYWLYISKVFEELEGHVGGVWEHPELHKLLLNDLWEKYVEDDQHVWSYTRVRAHSSGIALNAHSSSDPETDLEAKGLKALSHKLAEAALDSLGYPFPHDSDKLSQVETAILTTLIREWGTKSYEFTLKKAEAISSLADESKKTKTSKGSAIFKTLFRAHCYFGLNKISKTQDSLQHLKCYRECNLSDGVLKFLLAELGI